MIPLACLLLQQSAFRSTLRARALRPQREESVRGHSGWTDPPLETEGIQRPGKRRGHIVMTLQVMVACNRADPPGTATSTENWSSTSTRNAGWCQLPLYARCCMLHAVQYRRTAPWHREGSSFAQSSFLCRRVRRRPFISFCTPGAHASSERAGNDERNIERSSLPYLMSALVETVASDTA